MLVPLALQYLREVLRLADLGLRLTSRFRPPSGSEFLLGKSCLDLDSCIPAGHCPLTQKKAITEHYFSTLLKVDEQARRLIESMRSPASTCEDTVDIINNIENRKTGISHYAITEGLPPRLMFSKRFPQSEVLCKVYVLEGGSLGRSFRRSLG